jgi:hypothetical protein
MEPGLRDLLLAEMSRANTDFIAGIALKKPELVKDLWELFLSNEEPVSRRAAWVLDHLTETRPEWISDYTSRLIDALPGFSHDGLKRHALRMISRNPVPEAGKDLLMNICFEWLISRNEAVSAKVYCMEILYRICLEEPAIRHELTDSIEYILEEGTPGIRNFGKKILKKLYAIPS